MGFFEGISGCKHDFNGKNLVTKNMKMTNMTVYDTFSPVLLDFVVLGVMISAVSLCTHCCKVESSLTNLKAFASRQSGQTLCRCINACDAPPAAVS